MSDAAAATADAGAAGNGAAATAGAALLNGGAGANGSSKAATVDTGAAADAGKNGQAPAAKDGNGQSDWRAMFSQGLDEPMQKQWSSITGRYQSPAEFAKAHLELRNTAIFVPKDDAKPEAWDQVYDRLGRPKDAKEYKWNHLPDAPPLDEAEQEVRNGLAPVLHRLGATQKLTDGIIQWHDQQRKVQTDAAIARANTTTDTNIKTLKAEWGPDYDRNVSHHQTALRHYAGADFKTVASLRLSDGTFVADHPVIARMMSKIGAERAEDNRFAESFNPSSVADAKAQIAKIEGEAVANGLNPTSANWPHAQLDPLYARISGTKRMSPGEQFVR